MRRVEMRWWRYSLALLGALCVPAGLVLAANPNEREVKPRANVLDPDRELTATGELNLDSKIWVLEFRFKDPRLVTVDIPGRGSKLCWYLWYQVINRYKEPHTFIPDFELVTLDEKFLRDIGCMPPGSSTNILLCTLTNFTCSGSSNGFANTIFIASDQFTLGACTNAFLCTR